jgi:hypothetical protein
MIIDTFLEWIVIFIGILIALSVLFPKPLELLGLFIGGLIPKPSDVNKWLRKIGM